MSVGKLRLQTGDIVVKNDSAFMSADMAGDYVLLSLKDERYYGVDGVGSRLWELIQRPGTFGSLVDAIVAEFDVDRQRCAADVEMFLTELSERSVIEIVPDRQAAGT